MGLIDSASASKFSLDNSTGHLYLTDQPTYYLFNMGDSIAANDEFSKGQYGSWIDRKDITPAQYNAVNFKQNL
jgi:hypothetical protein